MDRGTPAMLNGEDEMGLADYLRILWRARRRIVVMTALGAAVGVTLSVATPRIYEAGATVSVETLTGDAPTPTQTGTARKLLESRAAAAALVRELDLDRTYGITADSFLDHHLRTAAVAGTDLLNVFVRLPDAAMAARAVNRFVQLAASSGEPQRSMPADAFLQDELRRARSKVDSLEDDIRKYKRESQIDVIRKEAERALQRTRTPGARSPELDTLYDSESHLDKLTADYEIATMLYLELALRAQQVRLMSVVRGPALRVVDEAVVPDRPASPRRMAMVIMAGAIGLVLAVVSAVLSALFAGAPPKVS